MACARVPAMISRYAQPTAIAIQSDELVKEMSRPPMRIGTMGVMMNWCSGSATALPRSCVRAGPPQRRTRRPVIANRPARPGHSGRDADGQALSAVLDVLRGLQPAQEAVGVQQARRGT
jgi:hypothetical protein